MPQRAGEAVSYLFPPAPSMALHRRIGWVTTTRPRDEAWIDAGKPLPASFFSTKKKERRKAGVSGVGTDVPPPPAYTTREDASGERRWCTEVILEVDWPAAVTGRLEASGSEPIVHLLFSSQNHLIGLISMAAPMLPGPIYMDPARSSNLTSAMKELTLCYTNPSRGTTSLATCYFTIRSCKIQSSNVQICLRWKNKEIKKRLSNMS
ncbi:hypothetical protein ACQ4PT_049687 [Festuca glaucescens]